MSTDWSINGIFDLAESTIETQVKDESYLFVSPEPVADATSAAQPRTHGRPIVEDAEVVQEDTDGNDDKDGDKDDGEDREEDNDEDEDGDDEEDDNAEHMEAINDKVEDIIASIDTQYDSSQERLPDLPAYHPAFKSIEQCRSSIIAAAIYILQTAKYKDAETAQLLEQAMALKQIRYPRDRKVALVGDSGTGKSSLINSLLDTPGLASEGSSGSACTSVVTEYQKSWPRQDTPFAAEIVFFDAQKRKSILRCHVHEFCRYHTEPREGLDNDALDDLESRCNTALEVFQALFADRPEFMDEDSTARFLEGGREKGREYLLDRLVTWADAMVSKYKMKDGSVRRQAYTVTELANRVEPFTKTVSTLEGENPRPSPWPLVEVVRVGLACPLLQQGLVLADLPGLSDTNLVRTQTTSRYRRQCDFLFLVSPIKRVATDNIVHQRLKEGSKSHGGNQALVCTYSDDINNKTSARDVATTVVDEIEHQRFVDASAATQAELTELNSRIRRMRGKAKSGDLEQKQTLALKVRVLKALCNENLMQLRNKKVATAMRKKYRDLELGNHSLDVHCVSNAHYTRHLEGYDEDCIPITIPSTGIPALRAFSLQLPALSKFGTLKQHCEGPLPSFISSLEMWSMKSASRRRTELRQIIIKPREAAENDITRLVEDILSHLTTCIVEKIRESIKIWTTKGMATAQKWADWNAGTYTAWCRHNGSYKTKSQPYVSWNFQLLEPVADDLEKPWKAFDAAWKESIEKCIERLTASVDNIREDLKSKSGASVLPMDPFMASLLSKKVMVRTCLEDLATEMEKLSRDIKVHAVADDGSGDAFLPQIMNSVYTKCAELSGKGSYRPRRALIENEIDSRRPFENIYSRVKKGFKEGLVKQQKPAVKAVEAVFDLIVKDYDRQFVVVETNDPSIKELQASLQRFTKESHAKINGPMQLDFARAMQKAKQTSL